MPISCTRQIWFWSWMTVNAGSTVGLSVGRGDRRTTPPIA